MTDALVDFNPAESDEFQNAADTKMGRVDQERSRERTGRLLSKDADGATPIAYLWARTIQCEGPGCGAEVPLIRSLWLAKKANRSVALQLVPNPRAKRVEFQIIVKQRDGWVDQVNLKTTIEDPKFHGSVKRGSATCMCCGYTTLVARVREQGSEQGRTRLHSIVSEEFLFSQMTLPPEFVEDLRRQNPCWEGRALPVLPPHRRHLVHQIQRRIEWKLAPIVVVRGPRQIGKTTAQLHFVEDLLNSGVEGRRILRVQFDDLREMDGFDSPILRVVDWFERTILGGTCNEAARRGESVFLLLDEVRNLENWAPQLKSLVDSSTVQVIVTGSSALRIEAGRDSLAGRITTLEAGTLSLTEIAALRGLDLGGPFLKDNGSDRTENAG